MTKSKYINFTRLNDQMDTAIRDAEIRSFWEGLSYSDLKYDKKITICSKKFCISCESIKKAIHDPKT